MGGDCFAELCITEIYTIANDVKFFTSQNSMECVIHLKHRNQTLISMYLTSKCLNILIMHTISHVQSEYLTGHIMYIRPRIKKVLSAPL